MFHKIHEIVIEGIDKTGKDSLLPYLESLGNYYYIINVRGLLSQLAYNDLYHREYEYEIPDLSHILFVLLDSDDKDLDIRFKITNEPEINRRANREAFNKAASFLENRYNANILRINTTEVTPYQASSMILDNIKQMEA